MHFDVFNGDADGIIALLQLRLAKPKSSTLITGVKRDISLVKQVPVARAKSVTVLDISMEKNSEALKQLLAADVDVFYVDHHRTGSVPVSNRLTSILDVDANTCTSLLVNQYLEGKYAHWAVAAAFGDNMTQSAQALANELGLSLPQQEQLKALGIYINYNGYGRSVEDLHFPPQILFKILLEYPNPLILIEDKSSVFYQLEQAYFDDMAKAKAADVIADNQFCQIVELPDQAWARRVSGVYGNELANQNPNKAHAVFTSNSDESFTVSLRAPLNNKQGADEICSQFPTGGGRAGAAGVNQLPAKMITQFVEAVSKYYQ